MPEQLRQITKATTGPYMLVLEKKKIFHCPLHHILRVTECVVIPKEV